MLRLPASLPLGAYSIVAAGSAPLIELSDSPDEQLEIETNVNPETVMAGSGGMDRSGNAIVTPKALVKGRRPNHPPIAGAKFRKTGRDLSVATTAATQRMA